MVATTTYSEFLCLDGGDDQLARIGVVDGALGDGNDLFGGIEDGIRQRGTGTFRTSSRNERSDVLGVGERSVPREL